MTESKEKKLWMPDSYIIIFFIVFMAAIATYIIPTGRFDVKYVAYDDFGVPITEIIDGSSIRFTYGNSEWVIDASAHDTIVYRVGDSEPLGKIKKSKARAVDATEGSAFRFRVVQEYDRYISSGKTKGISIFERGGDIGFLNYAFEGLVKGDKWGSAVGTVAFILIVGGAFGIVLKTGAVESGILRMISITRGTESLIIPVLFFLFATGGAVFGMAEETIPFAMIVVPLMIAMGYDAIVGLMIVFVASQIGFATSWMNPFSVAIAQEIAGIPMLSGSSFRIMMFLVFTTIGTIYTWRYASLIRKNPQSSPAWESDSFYREDFKSRDLTKLPFNAGHVLILVILLLGMGWIIWGVNEHEYYIPEIAAIFFTIGLLSGITGVVFRLNNMKVNDIATSFKSGAEALTGTAILVGMAQGIILVLGGSSPVQNSVLNTFLHSMSSLLSGMNTTLTALSMFFFQSVFNFFVVSGSGQAAITMPLMAPLAQMLGVSRQIAVLAFQLGDGLTNIIVPTSGVLMGVLGVARLDWVKWARFQIRFLGIMFFMGALFMYIAVIVKYS